MKSGPAKEFNLLGRLILKERDCFAKAG